MNNEKIGRFISYLLRHKPESLKLKMDKNGYVEVKELIEKVNMTEKYKNTLSIEKLEEIVATDSKKRYSYDKTKTKIRAVQGHSFSVDVAKKSIPPVVLYHGTSKEAYNIIRKKGIQKMNRDWVHLSKDIETAKNVGLRHCKNKKDLVILKIDTKRMLADSFSFFVAENGVWLSDYIPTKYIEKIENPLD